MTKSSNNIFQIKKSSTSSRIKYSKINLSFPSTPIVIPQSNTKIVFDDDSNITDKKILVLSLVKNISSSIVYFEQFIQKLFVTFNCVKFCFLSNNSQDNSKILLKTLKNKYPNNIEIIYSPDENLTISNRIEKFAKYRDRVLTKAINTYGDNFDYLIVFDSDLSDHIPVSEIVNSLKVVEPKWSCISGNHCYNSSSFYYDELALRFLDDPIDIQKKFTKFDEHYGKTQNWFDTLYIINDWVKVKCAFGGISIYHMDEILSLVKEHGSIYDVSKYPKFTAEHIALNLKLKNSILINPNIKYTNSANIEGTMYHQPITFIPRDAGFFSVFNFYIGCLTLGIRAYPYFNKKALLKLNGNINEHFCYWTTNENCWFDYFEPVKFFEDDTCHLTDEYKNFIPHRGEVAPDEFRIPKNTQALINDKEKFKEWRRHTHQFYAQHIKYHQSITNRVEQFWQNNFTNVSNIVGVHYRHPSHFIESGKVYLEQYFDKIDSILNKNPDSRIFLATDSNFGIYAFKEKYGDKVVHIEDIERLSMPEFLQWCFSLAEGKADTVGFINGKGYELQHKRVKEPDNKKLTVDLLTEVLCLSKCNSLVHTTSNVALAISYINPELELISL